jgi:hypothetical protein
MRSLDQNAMFHAWCAEIAEHLQKTKVMVNKDTVKELILRNLGNTKLIDNVPGMAAEFYAMRSHHYKQNQLQLTPNDRRSKYISMQDLLTKTEAWAATDLDGLILPKDKFYKDVDSKKQTNEEWLQDYGK